MDIDFLLIRNMKKGDEKAFDEFVRKYYGDILKYCGYHCFDLEYAEDLAQETFVHFFAKLSEYRSIGKTKNYLYTIAGNLCKNYYKKKKETLLEDEELKEQAGVTVTETSKLLIKIEVEEALEKLSEGLREVVVLYYFQELKLSEIADILKIGLPLVKYRIKRAKTLLKEYLEQE